MLALGVLLLSAHCVLVMGFLVLSLLFRLHYRQY
jgi:hypothetical protein